MPGEGISGLTPEVTGGKELKTTVAGVAAGDMSIQGGGGAKELAEVNARKQLQTNTENVVATHTFKAVENFETAAPNGYEQLTIAITGTYTGATIRIAVKVGNHYFGLTLVSIESAGNTTPTGTLITASANNFVGVASLPAGVEQVLVECTALATGEAVCNVFFGNEPMSWPALGRTQGPTPVAQEPAGIAPLLAGGVDGGTLMRRLRTDATGVLYVQPFNPEKWWFEKVTVGAAASAKESKTKAGTAGWIFVITQITLACINAATVAEYPHITLTVKEETSGFVLAQYTISSNQLTKGNVGTLALAANPISMASVEGKALEIELAKGTVAEGEGQVYIAGYMQRNK